MSEEMDLNKEALSSRKIDRTHEWLANKATNERTRYYSEIYHHSLRDDLKQSVLTSLIYTDVNQNDVLITTVNQWFDESIFYENTIKNLYYPSINYKEFKKYNENYFKKFKSYPNEMTILTYDALGLIYYAWKKDGNITSTKNFLFKNKIKGKIGTFSFKDKKVVQDLEIYKVDKNKFIKF